MAKVDISREGKPLTIGAVCRILQEEFDDVSISKIRFLEDQNLVTPRRTPGGYRLYGPDEVDRLRNILRLQRDEFLPLRVIRQELQNGPTDRGDRPQRRRTSGLIEDRQRRGGKHDWLLDEPPGQRSIRVTAVVVAELANALHMSVDEIDVDAEFISLGMDSLTAMELLRRLQAAMGVEIPASLFFAHPTVTALVEGLLAVCLNDSSERAKRPVAIPRMARDGELPLSHAQEQLWFLHELLPSSSAYNVAAQIDIPGPVNHDVLQRSFDAVMAGTRSCARRAAAWMAYPTRCSGCPSRSICHSNGCLKWMSPRSQSGKLPSPSTSARGRCCEPDSLDSVSNATCWC